MTRWISKTSFWFDSLIIESSSLPLTLLIILLHINLLNHLLTASDIVHSGISQYSHIASIILFVLAIVIFIDRVCVASISRHVKKSEVLRDSQTIVKGLSRAFIIGIGLLMLLSTLGISITPIIASLGIGSLAVALALQPTLENFFSGVQLIIDKPIRVGDFIELDSGEQGFVEHIGWRSTWIKMLPNNTVIMPNSELSKSKIINYFYPAKEMSVPVEVSVHYDSDLERVEEVTLEVAREILNDHPWGVETYDTFVVYHTFDSSSINFTVMLRAQEYFHQFFIRSAFIKALHKRFKSEGIVIPYPIRAVNLAQEKVPVNNALQAQNPTKATQTQDVHEASSSHQAEAIK
ncbi:mechanosensitive ion channel family protein [Pseudomaricurvus sp.]|uniref:mechanosensitive ion channel family protein n=1 Tax=Pseudomaricurvus sp. TaxID=2004510 RepID=UPI003F6D11B1